MDGEVLKSGGGIFAPRHVDGTPSRRRRFIPMTKILNLTQVIEEMVDAGDGERVSGREILEAFGERTYCWSRR